MNNILISIKVQLMAIRLVFITNIMPACGMYAQKMKTLLCQM